MDQENLNLNELLDDIRRIKHAIKQNSGALQQVFSTPAFKWTFFIAGLALAIIPLLYYLFLRQYGTYMSIPAEIRFFLIAGIIGGMLLTGLGKLFAFFEARQHFPQPSLPNVLVRLFSRQVLLIYPVLMGSMLFFTVFFIMQQNYHFIVPTFAIGMGIGFSMIGSFTSLSGFFFFGNYLWILGAVSVPFITAVPLSSLLWASLTFGLGLLSLSFYLMFADGSHKEN